LISIGGAILGRDFRAKARTLEKIGRYVGRRASEAPSLDASGRFVERRVFVAKRSAAIFFAFFFLLSFFLSFFLVYFLANGVARRYNEKRKVRDALPNLKKLERKNGETTSLNNRPRRRNVKRRRAISRFALRL
jgi:hypothetical protein